jgi:hypothetical protein
VGREGWAGVGKGGNGIELQTMPNLVLLCACVAVIVPAEIHCSARLASEGGLTGALGVWSSPRDWWCATLCKAHNRTLNA